MGDLTAYFSVAEFGCHCGCMRASADWRLVEGLTVARFDLGEPIVVRSGLRCPGWNRLMGGQSDSYHLIGAAADVVSPRVSLLRLYSVLVRIPAFEAGGIGVYPDADVIHVDVRGERARWGKIEGEFCSIHEALRRLAA